MSKIAKAVTVFAAAAALCAGSTGAQARSWGASHPRRVEVNSRLENQHDRIQAGLKDGQLTQAQAWSLQKEDHTIRTEERDMASTDGGHITRADQKALNQQENYNSTEIYDDRH